jgi:uncharacterized membrane protein
MSQMPTPTAPPAGPVPQQGNGLAVAGMVLGILGLVGLCIWFVGLPCAIVGLILSIMGKKKAKETGVGGGMATAGMICSIIALGLAVVGVIFAVVGYSMFGAKVQEMQRQMQQMPHSGPAVLLTLKSLLA